MAAIFIFSNVCGKGIFFSFYFVSFFSAFTFPNIFYFRSTFQRKLKIRLLKASFQKIIFLENAIFLFLLFLFSQLFEDFSMKTYEKTCHFYNIFLKFISNCKHLPRNFTTVSLSTTFARKLMKRPANFTTYFQSFSWSVPAQNIQLSGNFYEKNISSLRILTIFYSFRQI